MKEKIIWLIQETRGGVTRARIIRAIDRRPYNLYGLAKALNLNYKTVSHHIKLLRENNIITSEGGKYGKVYFISPQMKEHYGFFKEIDKNMGKKIYRLNPLLESGVGGIGIVTKDYRVKYQNKFLFDRFGDLKGKTCYKEYWDLKGPCDFCPTFLGKEDNEIMEGELTGKDRRRYKITCMPLKNPDGSVDSIEVIMDIHKGKVSH